MRRLRRRWQVWRILHRPWSLIWWSRCWRWKLVRRGLLPLPTPDAGSPPLAPRDLLRLRRPDTSEWERRHEIHAEWERREEMARLAKGMGLS